MLYQIGDIVHVREDLECDKRYYMDDMSEYDSVIDPMMRFAGRYLTVSRTLFGKYRLFDDNGSEIIYNWTDDMFTRDEPVFEESDMPVEALLFGAPDVKGGDTE